MRYLLLCCFDEKRWEAIPESKRGGIMKEYGELLQSLDQSGQHLASARLKSSSTATTVRGRTSSRRHRRPFAETRSISGLPPVESGPRRRFDREAHSAIPFGARRVRPL